MQLKLQFSILKHQFFFFCHDYTIKKRSTKRYISTKSIWWMSNSIHTIKTAWIKQPKRMVISVAFFAYSETQGYFFIRSFLMEKYIWVSEDSFLVHDCIPLSWRIDLYFNLYFDGIFLRMEAWSVVELYWTQLLDSIFSTERTFQEKHQSTLLLQQVTLMLYKNSSRRSLPILV